MNLMQKRHERINYNNDRSELRRLTSYLQAGYFRKTSQFKSIEESSLPVKGIFYFLAGASFLTGVFFAVF